MGLSALISRPKHRIAARSPQGRKTSLRGLFGRGEYVRKPRLRTRVAHIGTGHPQEPGDWSSTQHERATFGRVAQPGAHPAPPIGAMHLIETRAITYLSAVQRPASVSAQTPQEQTVSAVRLPAQYKINNHDAAIPPLHFHKRTFWKATSGDRSGDSAHYPHSLFHLAVAPAFPYQQVRNAPRIVPNAPHRPRQHACTLSQFMRKP